MTVTVAEKSYHEAGNFHGRIFFSMFMVDNLKIISLTTCGIMNDSENLSHENYCNKVSWELRKCTAMKFTTIQ